MDKNLKLKTQLMKGSEVIQTFHLTILTMH